MLIFVFGIAAIIFDFPRFSEPQSDELTQTP
jgi:hypothetical protein